MRRAAILAVIAFAPLSVSARQDITPVSNSLAKLHEAAMDVSPHGIIASSCISIQADGHFHLELRRQQLPIPTATLHIYEASLNNFQFQRLRELLDSKNIRDLGPYEPPAITGLTTFAGFDGHVTRENQVQNIGYFVWDKRPGEFDQSIPEFTKEQWRTAQTALVPLVQWFHEIEAMKWPEVPASSSNLCNIVPPTTN